MTSDTKSVAIQGPDGTAIPIDHLYAAVDAAAYLGVTTMSLWRWMREGKICPLRIARRNLFLRSDLDKLLSTRYPV